MFRRFAALAGALAIAALAPGVASASDFSIIAKDIVPSGEPGSVPPPAGADTQAKMYDGLTPLFNHVSTAQLSQFFKPDTLGVPAGATRVEKPHPGVTIYRDAYDVPHVIGVTRDDVTWGAGWVIAEDRGLLLAQASYDFLVAAVDAPGVSALGLVSALKSFKPTAQTEREVAKQTGALMAAGARGRAVLHDIDVYLQASTPTSRPRTPPRRRSRGRTSTPSTPSRTSSSARAAAPRPRARRSLPRSAKSSAATGAPRCGTTSARPMTPRRRVREQHPQVPVRRQVPVDAVLRRRHAQSGPE